MELRFWGVRGSTAAPGPTTRVVGGNTTCVSLSCGEHLFVFDAGTGIRMLGEVLQARGNGKLHGCIFFSHYHWDHIQGLPFFEPAFRAGNCFDLYGEPKQGVDLHQILREQMQPPFFPVPLQRQAGLVNFNSIGPDQVVDVRPGITVKTQRLRHPGGALGFRLEAHGRSLCVITDHEHPESGLDAAVVAFARGATVLVHDAQYTPDEKRGPRAGWGHSSWEEAALVARDAGVGTLFLSHHDPSRSDAQVKDIVDSARRVFPRSEAARESTVFDLSAGG